MFKHDAGVRAHKAWGVRAAVVAVQIAVATTAYAQGTPTDNAPSDAARRAAAAPYRMILMLSDTPRKKAAPEAVPEKKAKEATATAPAPQPAQTTAAVTTPAQQAAPQPAAEVVKQLEPPAQVATANSKPKREPRLEIVPIKTELPQMTTALLREHAEGTVKVGFWVKPDGSTGDVKVVASSNRKLNNISTNAVSGWKFEPIDESREVEVELVFKDYQQ